VRARQKRRVKKEAHIAATPLPFVIMAWPGHGHGVALPTGGASSAAAFPAFAQAQPQMSHPARSHQAMPQQWTAQQQLQMMQQMGFPMMNGMSMGMASMAASPSALSPTPPSHHHQHAAYNPNPMSSPGMNMNMGMNMSNMNMTNMMNMAFLQMQMQAQAQQSGNMQMAAAQQAMMEQAQQEQRRQMMQQQRRLQQAQQAQQYQQQLVQHQQRQQQQQQQQHQHRHQPVQHHHHQKLAPPPSPIVATSIPCTPSSHLLAREHRLSTGMPRANGRPPRSHTVDDEPIPELPPLPEQVAPMWSSVYKCEYHKFQMRPCSLQCRDRISLFKAALNSADVFDAALLRNYVKKAIKDGTPPEEEAKKLDEHYSKNEDLADHAAGSDTEGHKYGSHYVKRSHESILALPERLPPKVGDEDESSMNQQDLGPCPPDLWDYSDASKVHWPDPDPALEPADGDVEAKQCDRCGKWRYVILNPTSGTKYCVPTGGAKVDNVDVNGVKLEQQNQNGNGTTTTMNVSTAAAAANAASSSPSPSPTPDNPSISPSPDTNATPTPSADAPMAKLEGGEEEEEEEEEESVPAQNFDPVRAARMMGINAPNKFAPVHHSSDEDSDDDVGSDEELNRAARRRKKMLLASRKRMAAATKLPADGASGEPGSRKDNPSFPRAVIRWECSMNPDPSFNSCCYAQESIQPTYSIAKYESFRTSQPWNFASLGLAPITDASYQQFYRDPDGNWNKMETIVLLELIKDVGVEPEAWKTIVDHPLMKLRHGSIEDCQARFFTILALASLYGDSLTSPFAKRRYAAFQAQWAHLQGKPAPTKAKVISSAPSHGKASASKKSTSTPASERSRPSGTRLSSRLSAKQRTKYTYSSDDDAFFLSSDDEKPKSRSATAAHIQHQKSTGGGSATTSQYVEEEEPLILWKIEKILACRHRRVLRGHEESSADESEIEASIIDSTIQKTHIHKHIHLDDSGKEKEKEKKEEKKEDEAKKDEEKKDGEHASATASTSSDQPVSMDTSEEKKEETKDEAKEEQKTEEKKEGESSPTPSPLPTPSSSLSPSPPAPTPEAAEAAAASTMTPAAALAAASQPSSTWRSIRRHQPGKPTGPSGVLRHAPTIADPNYTVITEYLIKIEGQSFLHLEWHTVESMKKKFGGPPSRITQRVNTFHANQAEMEATNLDRYGGEPFDPRYIEVDRIVASNMVEVEEEDEERIAREQKNAKELAEWTAMANERALKMAERSQEDPLAAAQLAQEYMNNPLPPKPVPTPAPKPRKVEMYLVKWASLSYSQCTWETREDVDDEAKIAQYRRFNKMPSANKPGPSYTQEEFDARKDHWYTESPTFKSKNKLRDYQVEGVNFLIKAWHDDRNTILADEMGLGKTVQIVALFEHLRRVEHLVGPFLVVVPLGTISHWKREFENWTDFNTLVYHDAVRGKETRRLIRETEWYYAGTKQVKFNVMITTYEVLIGDIEELSTLPWLQVVVDEGHRIKNKSSKILEALQLLNCNRRLLLTGTPIQNSTAELFTLMNFLEPDVFVSEEIFQQQFGNLQESEQVQRLQEHLRPYVLRRMKEAVEKSIPPKEETIVQCELTTLQKKYYRAIYERNLAFLRAGTDPRNAPKLLNVEMELRKCCNHPWLIAGVEEKEISDEVSDQEYMKKTIEASGKMVLLSKLLPKLKADGHKVLLFSQMINVLDIVQEYMEYMGWAYERLDGSIRGTERESAIDRFSKKDSNRFLFMLSTRAGGVGLNLTRADTVIIFDSDWNPQLDIQAMARAHRIGQQRKVTIFRLVTRNTYESQMFVRASRKLGLDHAVLTNLEVGRGSLEATDKDDINKLLRLGAYGAYDDDDSQAKTFVEENIDDILRTRTQTIRVTKEQVEGEGEEGENGDSSHPRDLLATSSSSSLIHSRLNYNKMTFESSGSSSQLDINDPQFWMKIIPVSDSERYTPDQLLSQLTDGSAVESSQSKSDFFRYLQAVSEKILRQRREGEEVAGVDDLINLLIQFQATTAFSHSQRQKAAQWQSEAEKRIERRARHRAFPMTQTMQPSIRGRAREAKQRGLMATVDSSRFSYGDDGLGPSRTGRRRKGTSFGRITNVEDSSEEEGDSGSDFGGDDDEDSPERRGGRRGRRAARSDEEEEEDEEMEEGGSSGRPARRQAKSRQIRGKKRMKGILNLDICDECHQSGKLIACDGMCMNWYHLSCAGLEAPPSPDEEWVCPKCIARRHPCHACHEMGEACEPGSTTGGVNKCSIQTCGRFYHIECIRKYPITYFYENSNRFRCAQHYCAGCAIPGDSQSMIHCQTCPIGLHIRCITGSEIRLAKRTMYCASCAAKVRDTIHGQMAIRAASISNWEEPYREKIRPEKAKKKTYKKGGKSGKRRRRRTKAEMEAARAAAAAAALPPTRTFRAGTFRLKWVADGIEITRNDIPVQLEEYTAVRPVPIHAALGRGTRRPRARRNNRRQEWDSDDEDEDEDMEQDDEDDEFGEEDAAASDHDGAGEDDDEPPPLKPIQTSPTKHPTVAGKEPRKASPQKAAATPAASTADATTPAGSVGLAPSSAAALSGLAETAASPAAATTAALSNDGDGPGSDTGSASVSGGQQQQQQQHRVDGDRRRLRNRFRLRPGAEPVAPPPATGYAFAPTSQVGEGTNFVPTPEQQQAAVMQHQSALLQQEQIKAQAQAQAQAMAQHQQQQQQQQPTIVQMMQQHPSTSAVGAVAAGLQAMDGSRKRAREDELQHQQQLQLQQQQQPAGMAVTIPTLPPIGTIPMPQLQPLPIATPDQPNKKQRTQQ